jgi:hypothetical protein
MVTVSGAVARLMVDAAAVDGGGVGGILATSAWTEVAFPESAVIMLGDPPWNLNQLIGMSRPNVMLNTR